MASKSNTEVIIGGKVYTLSGYEGEEYLQRVAVYINNKINEFNEMEEFRRFTVDMKATLIQLNIADDYFKEEERAKRLEEENSGLEKQIYSLKHELIRTQMELDNTKAQISGDTTKLERERETSDLVKPETERKKYKKKGEVD